MTFWAAALWGLLGSSVAEALNLYGMMRPTTASTGRWQWPWRDSRDRPVVLFAVTLRLMAGVGLATASGVGGLATTPFAAVAFGATAPLIIAKMFDQIRIPDEEAETVGPAPVDRLGPVERRVMAVMAEGVSYDESQISSATLIAPSEVSRIVGRLVGRGIMQEETLSSGVRRYRLSPSASTAE